MKKVIYLLLVIGIQLSVISCQRAETSSNPADKILLKDFCPVVVNNLVKTEVPRAKFDIIDMHAHDYAESEEDIAQWCKTMDEVGVLNTAIMHCSWIGRPFEEYVAAYAAHKEHFRFWCCFDYTDMSPEGIEKACETLARYHEMGAVGVGELGDKGEGDTTGLYDFLGNGVGLRILLVVGILGISIDGTLVLLPLVQEVKTNDGLVNAVTWHVDTTNCYGYDKLMETFENAVRENPKTIFIACHYLNMSHDWPRLGALLDKYPNMYVDISARVAESAHTPRATREFLIKYQDRVLFGTDNGMDAEMYRNIFRVLESNDEHFYIPEYGYHWALSGFNLPDNVLKKLYHDNAERILKEYK